MGRIIPQQEEYLAILQILWIHNEINWDLLMRNIPSWLLINFEELLDGSSHIESKLHPVNKIKLTDCYFL